MAISIAKIKNNRAAVQVSLTDLGDFTLYVDPNRYTPTVESKFREAVNGGLPASALAEMVSNMVVGWDGVFEDETQEVKVSYDSTVWSADGSPFAGLMVLQAVGEIIQEEMTAKKK